MVQAVMSPKIDRQKLRIVPLRRPVRKIMSTFFLLDVKGRNKTKGIEDQTRKIKARVGR